MDTQTIYLLTELITTEIIAQEIAGGQRQKYKPIIEGQKERERKMTSNRFESGVSSYIKGTATVSVYFPVDRKGNPDCSCRQCRYFRQQSRTCALTGDISAYPDNYVGQNCPLHFESEDKNQ